MIPLPDAFTQRIETLYRVLNRWLIKDEGGNWAHPGLIEAIQRTVAEGYFTEADIQYQLESIHRQLADPVLYDWVQRVWSVIGDELKAKILKNQKQPTALCLHAGNLPLSGLQDILVVMLSGYRYRGKLSRQDPWLPASLIYECEISGFPVDGYSTILDELPKTPHADYLLFSGSEQTSTALEELLTASGHVDPAYFVQKLIRFASGSVALLDSLTIKHSSGKHSNQLLYNLIESSLIYSGRGCRSVSTVLSDMSLEEAIPFLLQAADEHRISNYEPTPDLRYEAAYGEAKGRVQVLIGSVLFREEEGWATRHGMVNWIHIKPEQRDDSANVELSSARSETREPLPLVNVLDYLTKYSGHIQSIYVTEIGGFSSSWVKGQEVNRILEPLSAAQNPSLDWKPDGIDPLEWLWKH